MCSGKKDTLPHHDKKETLPHLRMKRIASRRMSAGGEGQAASHAGGGGSNQLALEMLSHHTPGGLSSGSRRFSRLSLGNAGGFESGAPSPLSALAGQPLSRNSSFGVGVGGGGAPAPPGVANASAGGIAGERGAAGLSPLSATSAASGVGGAGGDVAGIADSEELARRKR